MGNFSHVGNSALAYRLLPRLIAALFIAVLLVFVLSSTISFLHIANSFGISLVIGGLLFIISFAFVYISAKLEYSNLQYLIEENSLYLKQGFFSVDTETIPFQKIRNAQFTQSILQRLYGVGNIIIDQDPETYIWISIDQKTAQTILEAISQRSNIQPIAVENVPQAPQK